jgi:hypothetical protein
VRNIALEGVLDLLERLAGMLDVDFVEPPLQVQDLLSVQHDIGGLTLEPAGRLMRHDPGIGQREAQVLGAWYELGFAGPGSNTQAIASSI